MLSLKLRVFPRKRSYQRNSWLLLLLLLSWDWCCCVLERALEKSLALLAKGSRRAEIWPGRVLLFICVAFVSWSSYESSNVLLNLLLFVDSRWICSRLVVAGFDEIDSNRIVRYRLRWSKYSGAPPLTLTSRYIREMQSCRSHIHISEFTAVRDDFDKQFAKSSNASPRLPGLPLGRPKFVAIFTTHHSVSVARSNLRDFLYNFK